MASITHTVHGETDPLEAPPSIAAHYTNTVTKARWISSGTDTVADWGRALPGEAVTYDQTIGTVSVTLNQPSIRWTVDRTMERTLAFDLIGTPGLHKFEVVLESYNSSAVTVQVSAQVSGPYFPIDSSFTVSPESANYYSFACWVTPEGREYWLLLDSRVLSGDLPRVNAFSDTVATVTLSEKNPLTHWNVESQKTRTLILPAFVGSTYLIEHTLILRNNLASELVVAIDEVEGLPLRDNSNLTVPAASTIMFKLVYYPRGGDVKWSVVSSHAL